MQVHKQRPVHTLDAAEWVSHRLAQDLEKGQMQRTCIPLADVVKAAVGRKMEQKQLLEDSSFLEILESQLGVHAKHLRVDPFPMRFQQDFQMSKPPLLALVKHSEDRKHYLVLCLLLKRVAEMGCCNSLAVSGRTKQEVHSLLVNVLSSVKRSPIASE